MATKGFEDWTMADVHRISANRGKTAQQKCEADVLAAAVPKKSKYRNQRIGVDGLTFDSRREADHWMLLKARETLGEITGLQRQVKFPLYAPELIDGRATGTIVQVSEYRADYVFVENGVQRVVDAKGHRTKEYLRSKKWLFLQQQVEVEEV